MKMERSFFQVFETLEDPRDNRGKVYPLMDIIILALYGVLIGFEDFTNMAYYLKKIEKQLTEKFGLEEGVPSHDVFSDVFRVLDVEQFMKLFVQWTKGLIETKAGGHIAIDGKAVRASAKKSENGKVPYVLSAYLCGCGISIGQKEVGEKTNGIREIPELLDLIDITGCFVTIDAIGTQEAIVNKILDKGGHFCLQLKENQKNTFESTDLFFRDLEENCPTDFGRLDSFVTVGKDHGRIEKREYYVFSRPGEMRGILGEKWKNVNAAGMSRLTRNTGGRESVEVHYHLMDIGISAEEYGNLARGHWQIENSLHWVLDIHFREDASTANSGNSLANLALLRKIAFNFTKLDPGMRKKTTKKKMIDFMTDMDLFKKFIYEVIPVVSE